MTHHAVSLQYLTAILPSLPPPGGTPYSGVLAAVHVARAGFPVRMQHGEFVNRYGLLAVNILQDAWTEAKKEHPDILREQERAVARCDQ